MSKRPKKRAAVAAGPRRAGAGRQRQRLIDACISALHLYGPSRTTVEKVVAIAKMSPGIVRFYFDSKAAMLVASLQFLAAEFEERVVVPVASLKSTPIAALQLLVELYLDPDIASPRKVSVWYAFWGEASSRQEYYDICGQKDEGFAVLVHELIAALIEQTPRSSLDADGVALGLIGALEILWQDIAFQTERAIDRSAARRRCMAYLRSVFPGRFEEPGGAGRPAPARPRIAGWRYDDARVFAAERDALFAPAWTVVGHESQLPVAGAFLTADTGTERVLALRDAAGDIQVLRNSCPASPHALVSGAGRFDGPIRCALHRLECSLDGRVTGGAGADLVKLDWHASGGLLFARSPGAGPRAAPPAEFGSASGGWHRMTAVGAASGWLVAADWKVLAEQWLESAIAGIWPTADAMDWTAPESNASGWSGMRYRGLVCQSDPCGSDPGASVPGRSALPVWHRRFLAPHQLLEARPDGLSVIQAVPLGPGRSRLSRFDFTVLTGGAAKAAGYLAQRVGGFGRRATLRSAESIQKGRTEYGYADAGTGVPPGVAWFRGWLAARLPASTGDWC